MGYVAIPLKASLRRRAQGQGLMEYALILALVSIAAIGSLMIFRPEVSSVLSALGSSV